jgi:flavin-dependent dehydrogenase
LFDAIGVNEAIERAGFIRSTGNTVWWGGADARVEPFADGARGWQLEVERLSQVLLERAMANGVQVESGVESSDPPEPAEITLDCTGRSGVLARAKNVRRYHHGPRTVALVAEWTRQAPWPVPDDTHTLIESYDDGWMWSVPVAPGVRHIAAMVDPQRSALARGGSSKDVYLAELGKARMFRQLIAGASLEQGPWGWDASPYHATQYAGDRWLLAGDAGSFIDPLSSAGVKKALASGWLAAITAHTWLRNPSMRAHALAFFDAREKEIEQHLSRESRRFLADAAQGHRHAFWEERSDDEERESEDIGEVQRALDILKSQDGLRARAGAIAIEPRPCIRGHEIVLEPHMVTPEYPRGVRYVRGIDLTALIELAPAARQVPDLYDACVRQQGPVELHDFLFALATAVARGWLVSE